jgi:hypothetical protein
MLRQDLLHLSQIEVARSFPQQIEFGSRGSQPIRFVSEAMKCKQKRRGRND